MATVVKEIDSIIAKHRQVSGELSVGMSTTIELGILLETQNEKDATQEMEEIMKSYVEMEQLIANHVSALENLKGSLSNTNIREFGFKDYFATTLKQVEIVSEKNREKNLKKHGKYREYRQKVWVKILILKSENSKFV